MFKYRGVNFIKTVYRPYCLLLESLFLTGYRNKKYWRDLIGFNYSLLDGMIIDGIYYYPEYHLKNFAQKVTSYILKDQKNFLSLKKKTLLSEKNILKASSNKKNISLDLFFEKYLEYVPTLGLYFICDDYIEDALRRELLAITTPEETTSLMSNLNLPLELNLDQKMKRWLLKTGDIKGFIKRYSWSSSRYGQHNSLSSQEAAQILKELRHEKKSENHDSRLEVRRAIKRAKNILGDKAFYVDVMQFFVYYRTHRTDILNKTFFDYYDALNNLASSLKINYHDLINCSYSELIRKKVPSKLILENRKENFVTCLSHGKIDIFSGSKVDYFRKLCVEKSKNKVIAGRTAFPGITTGKVKIISSSKDIGIFKKGEILVAPMTTPGMVMAMKKAIAFITDEGGITCHAAILAREMKKPCIIGTKIATKVLHDGDLVEVDANKGIVRIIKKYDD